MKYQSEWRKIAHDVITKVLAANVGRPERDVRKCLKDAYPFGERRYHPYKIWLDEIQRCTGKKHPIGHKKAWLNQQSRIARDQRKLEEWQQLYG
jgi:hypothetical protein